MVVRIEVSAAVVVLDAEVIALAGVVGGVVVRTTEESAGVFGRSFMHDGVVVAAAVAVVLAESIALARVAGHELLRLSQIGARGARTHARAINLHSACTTGGTACGFVLITVVFKTGSEWVRTQQ